MSNCKLFHHPVWRKQELQNYLYPQTEGRNKFGIISCSSLQEGSITEFFVASVWRKEKFTNYCVL